MAYAAAITPSVVQFGNERFLKIVVVETGVVDNTHQAEVAVPVLGRVLAHTAVLTAGDGTATTIDPALGESSGAADVLDNGTPAASTRDRTSRPFACDGTLYLRSRANGTTGTTGNVTTTIFVAYGH